MPAEIRVLIVEDNEDEARFLEEACRGAETSGPVVVEVAGNKAVAIEFLEMHDFDFAVCDLGIPLDAASLTPDRAHGLAVVEVLLERVGGCPLIVCSSPRDDRVVSRLVQHGVQADPHGVGESSPMLRFRSKEELLECKHDVQAALARVDAVASIELSGESVGRLASGDLRAIQVYARRADGRSADLLSFGPGHSAEKTLSVNVLDQRGESTARVVAKVGLRSRILKESRAFSTIARSLPPELTGTLIDVVNAGAGRSGAAIYGLAGNFDRNIFGCLPNDQAAAVAAVGTLRAAFKPLNDSAEPQVVRLVSLRRQVVERTELGDLGDLATAIVASDDLEVAISSCIQHGDLHGENVLVDRDGTPLLIDYAKVARTSACLDPLTLELSSIFHPGAREIRGAWPSVDQLGSWDDLDKLLEDCPYPDFIRSCREWATAVAASPQEIEAIGLSYALRQLRYDAEIRPQAIALASGCVERLTPGHA